MCRKQAWLNVHNWSLLLDYIVASHGCVRRFIVSDKGGEIVEYFLDTVKQFLIIGKFCEILNKLGDVFWVQDTLRAG